jgi:hypothetical protein
MRLKSVDYKSECVVSEADDRGQSHKRMIYADISAEVVMAIGSDLDRGIFPRVLDGGVVAPGAPPVVTPPSEGKKYVRPQGSLPSTPAPGASPATWPTGATASLERASLARRYEDELSGVQLAYPGTRVWRDQDGMWLLVPSLIIDGLAQAATFLLALNSSLAQVRTWGFWRGSVASAEWIGPRHTNFTDGSICAFDPEDGTWVIGDSLIALLDLRTVWAFRHLHLDMFQRWPGAQSVRHPHERRTEFAPAEFCGCGSSSLYVSCCSPRDAERKYLSDAVNFICHTLGGVRQPPSTIAPVILGVAIPPPIATVFRSAGIRSAVT